MKLKDIKTNADLINYASEKDKEIELLNDELKRGENTCNLLDKENLKLIDENEKLSIKIKELEQMLQLYKNKIQKLINENEKLKEKSFAPKTQEITDLQITKIKDLRRKGLSYRAIEKETGWSKFTIGKALKGDYDK